MDGNGTGQGDPYHRHYRPELVKNGIRIKAKDDDTLLACFDYCLLEQYMELVQIPWTPVVFEDLFTQHSSCIQVHKIRRNHHLGVISHFYQRAHACAIIMLNKRNSYTHEVDDQLMGTRSTTPLKMPVFLVSGKDRKHLKSLLIERKSHKLICEISPFSLPSVDINPFQPPCEFRPEKPAKDDLPHPKELLTVLSTDMLFTDDPSQFLMVKSICSGMELQVLGQKYDMDVVLRFLLRPSRLASVFFKEFPFYFAMGQYLLRKHSTFKCSLLEDYIMHCVDGLRHLPLQTVATNIKDFVKSSYPFAPVLEWVRDAFTALFETWLKVRQKSESPFPEGFITTAMICTSIAAKFIPTFSQPTTDLWEKYFCKHCMVSQFVLDTQTLYELSDGLVFMQTIDVRPEVGLQPHHLCKIVGSPRHLIHIKELIAMLIQHCPKHWEDSFLSSFLSPLQQKYRSAMSKVASTSKPVSFQETVSEGLFVINLVFKLAEENKWDMEKYTNECQGWMTIVLSLIDFSHHEAPVCIKKVTDYTRGPIKALSRYINRELNTRFKQASSKSMPAMQFLSIFQSSQVWQTDIVQNYMSTFQPPPKTVISDDTWQALLASTVQRLPGGDHHEMVLKLFYSVGNRYRLDNRANQFVVDLFKLNVPTLFAPSPLTRPDDCLEGTIGAIASQFKAYLRTYIQNNGLRKEVFLSIHKLLEICPVLDYDFYKMLIVSIILNEVLIGHVIFDKACLPTMNTLLKTLIYYIHHCIIHHCHHSTRARFSFGIFAKVLSEAYGVETNLHWLEGHSEIVIAVCTNFKKMLSLVYPSEDQQATALQEMRNLLVSEIREFIQMLETVQGSLKAWTTRVHRRDVTLQELQLLQRHHDIYNHVASLVSAREAYLHEDILSSVKTEYEDVKKELSDLFIRVVPSHRTLGWCLLQSILGRINVVLPQEILTDIGRYVSLPKEIVMNVRTEAIQLEPIPMVELEDSAHLAVLKQLKQEIQQFLLPLDEFFECLVFFHLYKCYLFFQYVNFYYKNFEKEQALFLKMPESFSPISVSNLRGLSSSKTVSADVTYAVKMAVQLIHKLLEGSAKYFEITLNESLNFSDRNIELEFGPLKQFAEISRMPNIKPTCLDGVKDLLDLQDIAKKMLTISDVCEVYELQGCLSDDDFIRVLRIANELQDKQHRMNITLQDASSKLHLVKEKLCISSSGNKKFLDLFSVVKHSIPFHCFAMEKGFGGGDQVFRDQYRLVSAQLQHEEYDHTVLSNLAGAFKFIEPFLDKQQSFGELMDKVSMLTNISNGIQQLETVNNNIELIKIWFQKAEGETVENIDGILRCIYNTGVCCFSATEDSPIEMKLVFDPTFWSNHKHQFGQESSLEDSVISYSSPIQRQREEWSVEKMSAFLTKLGFISADKQAVQGLKWYQHIFKNVVDLLTAYQELKYLGHYMYIQKFENKLPCNTSDASFMDEVEHVHSELKDWKEKTAKHRAVYPHLAFFSMAKVLRLYHLIQAHESNTHSDLMIIREVIFLFTATQLNMDKLSHAIKNLLKLQEMGSSSPSISPLELVGQFLQHLFKCPEEQAPTSLISSTVYSSRLTISQPPLLVTPFILHSLLDFTRKDIVRLIFSIFQDALSASYQLLRCSRQTRQEDLELFFTRINQWDKHHYLIMGVNLLSNELQEALVDQCSQWNQAKRASGLAVEFVEYEASVLRQMPWVAVTEYRDSSKLPTIAEIKKRVMGPLAPLTYLTFELVNGRTGDGKTHYIMKRLQKCKPNPHLIIPLNESFEPVSVINKLRALPQDGLPWTIYINFTYYPIKQVEAYEQLSSDISWFFFDLFVMGYVEDAGTGLSFSVPPGKRWSIYVEVPAVNETGDKPFIFDDLFPAFSILGEPHQVAPDAEFEVDEGVMLVCKYLQAYHTGNLDRLCLSTGKNKAMPVLIGEDSNLSNRTCQELIQKFLPNHALESKIRQNVFLRYMVRRCKFLENCPALQFNDGTGPPIVDENGKKTGKFADITKLRSTLLRKMLEEVGKFCNRDMVKSWSQQSHQQLIYDFKDGGSTFGLLSLNSNLDPSDQELFVKLGIELPSIMKLRERENLDQYLSRALAVPLEKDTKRISAIDDQKYVLTTDYAIKMLNIHERRMCGMPIVIQGETGVGKTFLLQMMSVLWNQQLIAELNLIRSRIVDKVRTHLNNFLLECSCEESQSETIHSALDLLSGKADKCIPVSVLREVVLLKDVGSRDKSSFKFFYESMLSILLNHRFDPVFMVLSPPEEIVVRSFEALFQEADQCRFKKASDSLKAKAVAELLYGFLYGTPICTFFKLSVHAAMKPAEIREFFKPIVDKANVMMSAYEEYENYKRLSPGLEIPSYQQPVITVFMDEINTSSCLGFLKEILIDRMIDGEELPQNIFIVAACNPYRTNSLLSLNKEIAQQSVEQWTSGSYYVHPLHPTIELLMWDYGALEQSQERQYIFAKLKMIEKMTDIDCALLTEPIVESQRKMRHFAAEQLMKCGLSKEQAVVSAKSSVSQRDIQRVFGFYEWLKKSHQQLDKYKKDNEIALKLRVLYVSLALVYYFRLNSEYRKLYAKDMETLTKKQLVTTSSLLESQRSPGGVQKRLTFQKSLQEELDWLIDKMTIPPRVAHTEALKENLYAIVVCAMTHTPLIIVGPPGSSKTLSFKITVDNLQGQASPNETFRTKEVFHALEPKVYQCSRHSTSNEIQAVFKIATDNQRQYTNAGLNTYSIVMLDEAGLPEESHESLKVLHYHLDQQEISFLAISNHVLDAAKSNRAISLFRSQSSESDILNLAEGCIATASNPSGDTLGGTELIHGCCAAYLQLMKSPQFSSRFGLRDLIHFFTYLHRRQCQNEVVTAQTVMNAIERNFNSGQDFHHICDYFLREAGSTLKQVKQHAVLDTIKASLEDHTTDLTMENEIRYKLLIDTSGDESIIRFLFAFGVLQRDKTRIYVCSKFPGDTETQKVNMIAAIRHSAIQGHTVLLSQADEIHENFYDLFNQHFTRIHNPQHGLQYYANVAIGAHVKPSQVDPAFQCMVVIKESEVESTPAPFLNRFEKYTLSHHILLQDLLKNYRPQLRHLIEKAKEKVGSFLTTCGSACLYGQQEQTLDSLLLSILPLRPKRSTASIITSLSEDCSKEEALLRHIIVGLINRFSFRLSQNSSKEYEDDAQHILTFVCEEPTFNGCWKMLNMTMIPLAVNKMLDDLLLAPDKSLSPGDDSSFMTAVLLQWLVTFLCKKLMQLMTPEALLNNHKKIPSHYISAYLNHQNHFSLNEVVTKYQSCLAIHTQDIPSVPPNKILCFTRTSVLIHSSIDKLFSALTLSQETTRICKLSTATTSASMSEYLKEFINNDSMDVLVLIANMQEYSKDVINHLRILIEEIENSFQSVTNGSKLYVLLLHFSSEMFFQHCYPSYFLSGWDHYYLDSIAPSEQKGTVNIASWFKYCCMKEMDTSPHLFLERPLQEILEDSIPAISARLSLSSIRWPNGFTAREVLCQLFGIKSFTEILIKRFCSYWKPKVMTEFSEQAANLAHSYESTLSITDAIHTIVRSSFYEFVLSIVMMMNKEGALGLLLLSQSDSSVHKLCLKLLGYCPIPKTLEHLRIHCATLVQRDTTNDEHLKKSPEFPFFGHISKIVDHLLFLIKPDVDHQLGIVFDDEQQGIGNPFEAVDKENLRAEMVTAATIQLAKLEKVETYAILFGAIEVMDTDEEIWRRYFTDYISEKLHLKFHKVSAKAMEHSFANLLLIPAARRIIELHVYIQVYGMESGPLSMLRTLDLLEECTALSLSSVAGEPLGLILNEPERVAITIVNTIYEAVKKFAHGIAENDATSIKEQLKKFSPIFHITVTSLPSKDVLFEGMPSLTKVVILLAVFTILHCDEGDFSVESTLSMFQELDEKMTAENEEACELSVCQTLGICTQFFPGTSGCINALTKKCTPSIHLLTESLLRSFFSLEVEGKFGGRDFTWLCEIANYPEFAVEIITGKSEGSFPLRCIRYFLNKFLLPLDSEHEEEVELNPLLLFRNKWRSEIGEILFHTFGDKAVPTNYKPFCDLDSYSIQPSKKKAKSPDSSVPAQPLAHLYFATTLEAMIPKTYKLSHCIILIQHIDKQLEELSVPPAIKIILDIEKAALVHVLTKQLAHCVCNRDQAAFDEVSEVLDDINKVLMDPEDDVGTHGLMLSYQILQTCKSSKKLMHLLVTNFADLCRDFVCLRPINAQLSQGSQKPILPIVFPHSLMQDESTEEGQWYKKMKTVLMRIRQKNNQKKLLAMASNCYAAKSQTKSGIDLRYTFNMLLWLFIYYELYCEEKTSPELVKMLENELNLYILPEHQKFMASFADPTTFQTVHENISKSSEVGRNQLYQLFFQTEARGTELQNSLAGLVAIVLGTPPSSNHLERHVFSPQDLKDTFVPGSMLNCKLSDKFMYDQLTIFDEKGLLSNAVLQSAEKAAMGIQCMYFTTWANYGALCMSLLVDPLRCSSALRDIFSDSNPIECHCLLRMEESWRLLYEKTNLTVEESALLVGNCLGNIYKKCVSTAPLSFEHLKDEGKFHCYNEKWQDLFSSAWKTLLEEIQGQVVVSDKAIGQSLRTLSHQCPVSADSDSFLMQILSSAQLTSSDTPLRVLYQFLLKRPQLAAGANLLPILLKFYHWIHDTLSFLVTEETAKKLTIQDAVETYLQHNYPARMRDEYVQIFEDLKVEYHNYSQVVNGPALLSSGTLLKNLVGRDGILFTAITKIIHDYNVFIEILQSHCSNGRVSQCLANLADEIPLTEVTAQACNFGSSKGFYDVEDLMPLIRKCCNLTGSSEHTSPDPTLLKGCVPQVYALDELQDDIIQTFLVGKKQLQKLSSTPREFYYKNKQIEPLVSKTMITGPTLNMEHLQLPNSLMCPVDASSVEYECHSMSYYTLLEVIIGLRSALSHIEKISQDGWFSESSAQLSLENFLAEYMYFGVKSGTDILHELGIQSVTPLQRAFLLDLKVKDIFSTLKFLMEWMEFGIYDFCSYPMSMKVHLESCDYHEIQALTHSYRPGSLANLLEKLKALNKVLVKADSDLRAAVAKNPKELISKVVAGTGDILSSTNGIQVQHYVHFRLAIRRVIASIHDDPMLSEVESIDEQKWDDRFEGLCLVLKKGLEEQSAAHITEDDQRNRYGFEPWYEKDLDADLEKKAKLREVDEAPSIDTDSPSPKPVLTTQLSTSSSSSLTSGSQARQQPPADDDKASAVSPDLKKLASLWDGDALANFLKNIGMEDSAEEVLANEGVSGDMVINDDRVQSDLHMDTAVKRLRFNVLFSRQLVEATSDFAKRCPVDKVIDFCKQHRILNREYTIEAIKKNSIDGEMLITAEDGALEELGIPALGKGLIQKKLQEFAYNKFE